MSTHRGKRVSLPAQPGRSLEQQLAAVEDSIKNTEVMLAYLKQRQADLKKQLNPEKLWPCRFCPAQLPYNEVYKHTQDLFESEVIRG